jgi:O-antigen/teichoic acid export membrane protein
VHTAIRNYLKKKSLTSNAGVYVFGSILQKAVAFLMIPLYTRFLTPEDYGITGVALAVGSVLSVVLGFGISSSVLRQYHDYKDNPEQLKKYITTTFVFLILVAGSLAVALHVFGGAFWRLAMSGEVPFAPYIQIAVWDGFGVVVAQVALSLYRTQQKAGAFMFGQVGDTVLTHALTILFVVVWHLGATGILLGSMVASGLTAIVLSALLLRKWFSVHLEWKYLWIGLAFGIPLVPHSLSTWIMTSVDRLLLEPRVSLSELGMYTLGYQIGQVMAVLVSGFNFAWAPYYYNLVKTDPNATERIKHISELYLGVMGGICLVGVLFSPEILRIMAPQQYQMATRYVPLVLFSYLFNGYYYFASMPLFYFKKVHIIPLATLSSALLNVLLNLWWIPIWGALGSAWATFVVYVCVAIIAFVLGRRWQKIDYPLKRFALVNALIFVGVILTTYGSTLYSVEWILIKASLLVGFWLYAYPSLIRPNLNLVWA